MARMLNARRHKKMANAKGIPTFRDACSQMQPDAARCRAIYTIWSPFRRSIGGPLEVHGSMGWKWMKHPILVPPNPPWSTMIHHDPPFQCPKGSTGASPGMRARRSNLQIQGKEAHFDTRWPIGHRWENLPCSASLHIVMPHILGTKSHMEAAKTFPGSKLSDSFRADTYSLGDMVWMRLNILNHTAQGASSLEKGPHCHQQSGQRCCCWIRFRRIVRWLGPEVTHCTTITWNKSPLQILVCFSYWSGVAQIYIVSICELITTAGWAPSASLPGAMWRKNKTDKQRMAKMGRGLPTVGKYDSSLHIEQEMLCFETEVPLWSCVGSGTNL